MAKTKEQEAVEELLSQEVFVQQELDMLADMDAKRGAFKRKLPMFFTARGNVIKVPGFTVNTRNFSQIYKRVEDAKFSESPLCARTDHYTVYLSQAISDEMRELGFVETLIISGWKLSES